jgi:hypothetical protein
MTGPTATSTPTATSALAAKLIPSTGAEPATEPTPTTGAVRALDSAPNTYSAHPATSLTTQRLRATRPSIADQPSTATAPATPCETAARIAILNKVHLTNCNVTTDAVTVEVSLKLDLPLGHPTLSATARAGPL